VKVGAAWRFVHNIGRLVKRGGETTCNKKKEKQFNLGTL
jgi:hypothetical protein